MLYDTEHLDWDNVEKDSFYGGKNGIDYVCFDSTMKVIASGKLESMMKLAEQHNYAVAEMKALRFKK